MAAETSSPDRLYLNLENVRGTLDAIALSIFINLPEGSNPADHPEVLAGTVGLFGLRPGALGLGLGFPQGPAAFAEGVEVIQLVADDRPRPVDQRRAAGIAG